MSGTDTSIRQRDSDWRGYVARCGDVIELSWHDGMTDMTAADFRWLVEVAGPAILADKP